MAGPQNLTDRLSHLRERKSGSQILSGERKVTVSGDEAAGVPVATAKRARLSGERKIDTDYFVLFVYSLLTVSIVCQALLIVWLDLI